MPRYREESSGMLRCSVLEVVGVLPALITSTPAGSQRSPGRNRSSTVLAGRVRKYSASSTWVPSLSRTSRTGSPTDTPSLSRPRCTSSSKLPTTRPLRTLRRPSHSLKGLFPRDSYNTPYTLTCSSTHTINNNIQSINSRHTTSYSAN